MGRPLLIFDGDCVFCRRWVARWRRITGDRVVYAPYQEAGSHFQDLSQKDFSRSVILIEGDGRRSAGAEAVFRVLRIGGRGGALWFYQNIPGVRFISEIFYRLVASHRVFFSHLTRLFWGRNIEPPTYEKTRRVFLTFLGVIYFFAFLSLALQIQGLIGSQGILPAQDLLQALNHRMGADRFWNFPTLFWWKMSDHFLSLICWGGVGISIFLILGILPAPSLVILWIFYLSLFQIGRIFLGYQWDVLLLETGFLAIFFAPWTWRLKRAGEPSHAVLWLLRWLLFRLMFSSGMVKILSGDPTWEDLTALTYHYWTQPLPVWISYYANLLPIWFQKISCALMFGIEVGVPFLIFTPRRIRMLGGFLMIGLQILIMATGNYNFFNLLAMALCLTLLDDHFFSRFSFPFLRHVISSAQRQAGEMTLTKFGHGKNWSKWILGPVAAFLFLMSWVPFLTRLDQVTDWPTPFRQVYTAIDPFNLVNSYGLFAVMTTRRLEITVEGSNDGETWLPYEFQWKPGDLKTHPKFVEPFQPRLDWQMWFQALAPYRPYSWFHAFLIKLLEGSPPVLALMKTNPFPDHPPLFIRSMITEYHFTDLATKHATGEWWMRGPERVYSPSFSLEKP